jgi:hypothetical protein
MEFRFVGRRPGAGLHPDGISPIVFTKGRADRRVRIQLEDVPREQRLELRCEVVVNIRLKSTIAQAFSSLEAGQMPEGSSSPERPLGQLSPSGEIRGRIASIPMSLLPERFQQFAATIQERLRAKAYRAMQLLRWRACELGPERPFTVSSFAWRRSDHTWESFPGGTGLSLDYVAYLDVQPAAHDELQTLFSSGYGEPVAYELIREAWALRETSPRTSLSIAITALEIGVKQFMAQRVPEDQRARITDEPFDDILTTLKHEVPTLPPPAGSLSSASTLAPLPEDLLQLLERRRHQRNRLSHNPKPYLRATGRPTRTHAIEAVLATRQVLVRLDVANGHLWARQHLADLPMEAPPFGHLLLR